MEKVMKKILFTIIVFIFLFGLISCPETPSDDGDKGGSDNGGSGNNTVTTPPTAPSDLQIDYTTFCRIVLSWTDNADNESSFILERSIDPTFLTVTEITISADAESYSDRDGINQLTHYYYRIKAANSAGESADSNTADTTTLTQTTAPSGNLIADHTIINRLFQGSIPVTAIQNAKSSLHIGYGHTSHGSQITDGMSGLVSFANGSGLSGAYSLNTNLFSWNRGGTGGALDLREGDGYGSGDLDHDCGYYPNWVDETRAFLDNPDNYEVNVIIWSWCGQASGRSDATMLSTYLTPMTELENDYPDITFIYMTGHLNGTGATGNLNLRNEQIRTYCINNNKWLFDFADIESYDPDGAVNYMTLLGTDGCYYDSNSDGVVDVSVDANWAVDWQNTHTQNTDWYNCGSAHSEALNANMKAYAAWWMWCRLAGWDGI